MATEEEKKRNLVKLSSLVIHGLTKALWDMVGEASYGTAQLIGRTNLTMLEKDMGFEIAGEDPKDMLTELNRIFVDEIGAMADADAAVEDDRITLTFKNCLFMRLTKDLMNDGIPPFICPFMGMAMASMRERLGKKARLLDSKIDSDSKVCVHVFELF